MSGPIPRTKRRTLGLLMLALVICLWTASNFLASAVLADDTYDKPYALTYLNTAFFVLPLVPILGRKAVRRPEELRGWWRDCRGAWVGRRAGDEDGRQSISDSRELLLGYPPDDHPKTEQGKLSLWQTTRLSFEFCMLWFLANYWVAASLEYTTVASSTILTSTSSVFTLLIGVLYKVEPFTLRKLLGVLASLAGIILISTVDLSGRTSDSRHRGHFPKKSLRDIAVGDALAFLSACMYGIYAVLMKKRIADETSVNMPLFFGLVGLVNLLLLWPAFPLLHWTGIEAFEMPPTARVTAIIITNSIASLVADIAWAYAVLLTSPIIVTVGLSLTIPLSLIGQIVLNGQTATAVYWVGALVVVASFIFVNLEPEQRRTVDIDGRHVDS